MVYAVWASGYLRAEPTHVEPTSSVRLTTSLGTGGSVPCAANGWGTACSQTRQFRDDG